MRDRGTRWTPLLGGLCEEPTCGKKLPEGDRPKRFCDATCYKRYKARAAVRGVRIWEALDRWRGAPRSHRRGAGATNAPTGFSVVTQLVDEFRRDDRNLRALCQTAETRGAAHVADPG
mgnify:CR=1 FL=1